MTTPKQRNERLLQVCRVLRELPKGKRFDLGRWYKCGSVACACGWAAADPWFNKRGLRLEKISPFAVEYPNTHSPGFKADTGFDAIMAFFGLDLNIAFWMFDGDSYNHRTRRDVIRRIEKFVRDNPA